MASQVSPCKSPRASIYFYFPFTSAFNGHAHQIGATSQVEQSRKDTPDGDGPACQPTAGTEPFLPYDVRDLKSQKNETRVESGGRDMAVMRHSMQYLTPGSTETGARQGVALEKGMLSLLPLPLWDNDIDKHDVPLALTVRESGWHSARSAWSSPGSVIVEIRCSPAPADKGQFDARKLDLSSRSSARTRRDSEPDMAHITDLI